MKLIRLFPALLVFALAATAAAQERSPKDVLEDVDRHYNRLRAFSADFVELYRGAGVVRQESGRVWLKRPGRMRWEYRQPREKLFVSDGKTAYFYVPGDQQARRASLKKLDDLRSPLRFLLGKARLEKELDDPQFMTSVAPLAPGNVVVRGRPRNLADRVDDLVLEITPAHQIARIIVYEVDGATTEFRFTDIVENPAVADASFRFAPPPGVQVIETRDVAP